MLKRASIKCQSIETSKDVRSLSGSVTDIAAHQVAPCLYSISEAHKSVELADPQPQRGIAFVLLQARTNLALRRETILLSAAITTCSSGYVQKHLVLG